MQRPSVKPHRLTVVAAVFALSAVATGCQTTPSRPAADDSQMPGGTMISRTQIERSGARDAYEALIRARTHLVIEEPRGSNEARIRHRGRDSLVDSGQVLVILDGTPTTLGAVAALREIPANQILYMKVLSAREATPRYGMLAGNGAIYVRTTTGT